MTGTEEENHSRDIVWCAGAAHRNLRFGAGQELGVVEGVLVHGGENHARRDVVDGDAMRSELERHGAGEIANTAFGHAIGAVVGDITGLFVNGRDIDDAATIAARHHAPRRLLSAQKRPVQVGSQDAVPFLP